MTEGFFSRWSRRKQEVSQGEAPPRDGPDRPAQAPVVNPVPVTDFAQTPQQAATVTPSDQAPLPTLGDVQALTPGSDFQPFMQRGVGAEVRNAAMKKLFADPHFNLMDGLDVYIDDYSQADPMPVGMLQQMASAQFLELVPPEAAGSRVVAQSPDTSAPAQTPDHDDPDLQLQPDPAPANPRAEPGAD